MFPSHVDPVECEIIGRLIDDALASDMVISVYDMSDGKASRCMFGKYRAAICRGVGIYGETTLLFHRQLTFGAVTRLSILDYHPIGWVRLTHGCGYRVISDTSECQEIIALVGPARAIATFYGEADLERFCHVSPDA